MLNTRCNNCVFLDKQRHCCLANRFCLKQDKIIYSPGYCRMFREQKWAKNTKEIQKLLNRAQKECEFYYDLVLLFNEYNTISDLHKTVVSSLSFANTKNIIIVCNHIQDKSTYQKIINFCKRMQKDVNCMVKFSTEYLSNEQLLQLVSTNIKSRYFLCMYSGKFLVTTHSEQVHDKIRNYINHRSGNEMMWLIKERVAHSNLTFTHTVDGIYITDLYKKLSKNHLNVKQQLLDLQNKSHILLVDTIDGVKQVNIS